MANKYEQTNPENPVFNVEAILGKQIPASGIVLELEIPEDCSIIIDRTRLFIVKLPEVQNG